MTEIFTDTVKVQLWLVKVITRDFSEINILLSIYKKKIIYFSISIRPERNNGRVIYYTTFNKREVLCLTKIHAFIVVILHDIYMTCNKARE